MRDEWRGSVIGSVHVRILPRFELRYPKAATRALTETMEFIKAGSGIQ